MTGPHEKRAGPRSQAHTYSGRKCRGSRRGASFQVGLFRAQPCHSLNGRPRGMWCARGDTSMRTLDNSLFMLPRKGGGGAFFFVLYELSVFGSRPVKHFEGICSLLRCRRGALQLSFCRESSTPPHFRRPPHSLRSCTPPQEWCTDGKNRFDESQLSPPALGGLKLQNKV